MSDLNRSEMHGPVRALRTHFAEWNPDIGAWRPLKSQNVMTFRPDGQLSEGEYHNPDGSVVRHARVYTDSGRLTEDQCPIEEVTVHLNRDMRIGDGAVKIEDKPSHVQHVGFEYQYDAYGNWTERVVWQRTGPQTDERRSSIERRTITYYADRETRS